MNYAVDYATKGMCKLVRWSDSQAAEVVELLDIEQKLAFLDGVTGQDQVFLENGGAGDKFAYGCAKQGAKVFRINPGLLKNERQDRNLAKEESHWLIQVLATEQPERFYPLRETDLAIVELRVWTRGFYTVQQNLRIPAELRLLGLFRDIALVTPREQITAADVEAYCQKQFLDSHVFRGLKEEEKELKKRVESILKGIELYSLVFKPIKGVGPLIAGRIIAEIGDIRRFRSEASLKAYAGYHLNGDKQVPKRKAGVASNWNPHLKQAVYAFCDQVNRRPGTSWNEMLAKRKELERQKDLEASKGHIHNRAMRYVGQKFLEQIFREWTAYEEQLKG